MVKVVKFTSPMSVSTPCSEQQAGCEAEADIHVCFEDGSGVSVCRSCFDQRINEGAWITDSCECLAVA
jgi:hypothetical protein